MPITTLANLIDGKVTFDLSAIMSRAWQLYRTELKLAARMPDLPARPFARFLKEAWAEAKREADFQKRRAAPDYKAPEFKPLPTARLVAYTRPTVRRPAATAAAA